MEGMEEVEFVGSSSNNDATVSVTAANIAKGKRTKRQRPFSPCAVVAAMACSSSTVSGEHVSGGAGDCGSISSTTTTNNYESTEEEEDMANCLILLAQGRDSHRHTKHQPQSQSEAARPTERGGSRRFTDMPTATGAAAAAAKIGFYVYECKTCNRTFPSFQALGGHRASHKKPKLALEEKKPQPPPPLPPISSQLNNYETEESQIKSSPQISLQLSSNIGVVHSNKAKIHECSICGSEFTSGQALGGHMRRHRASTITTSTPAVGIETGCNVPNDATTGALKVKPRNILALDLNLPAPEEDLRDSKFQFTPKQKPLALSAPSLVDCHY